MSRPNFGGTDAQWKIGSLRILQPYADCFWDTGYAAPIIRGFEGDIVPKAGAVPSARPPFKLSAYDEARLEQQVMEFEDAGQLYPVSPEDAEEWPSPSFVVDNQGDLLVVSCPTMQTPMPRPRIIQKCQQTSRKSCVKQLGHPSTAGWIWSGAFPQY